VRAWDKRIKLELDIGHGKVKTVELSTKEGLEILAQNATSGSERLVMKGMLAIMEEIDKLDPKGAIRGPELRAAVDKLDATLGGLAPLLRPRPQVRGYGQKKNDGTDDTWSD
jgi:hypothetical protein